MKALKKELVHIPEVFILPINEIDKYSDKINKEKLFYSKVERESTRFSTLIYFYNEKATKYLCFRAVRSTTLCPPSLDSLTEEE